MKATTYTQHEEHKDWLNKLAFYKDETTIMQKHLDEISSKNTALDTRKEIEHFQNQITVQKHNLDELKRRVKDEERKVLSNIKKNPKKAGSTLQTGHVSVGDMVASFENNFNNLRKEYNNFLGKKM